LSVCLLWCDSRQRAHEPYTHANEPCIQFKSPTFYQNLERGVRPVCLPCSVYLCTIYLLRSPTSLPKSRAYPQKIPRYRSWGVSCASSSVTKQCSTPTKEPFIPETCPISGPGACGSALGNVMPAIQPYIPAKEPCIPAQEHDRLAKEPYKLGLGGGVWCVFMGVVCLHGCGVSSWVWCVFMGVVCLDGCGVS